MVRVPNWPRMELATKPQTMVKSKKKLEKHVVLLVPMYVLGRVHLGGSTMQD